MLKTRPYLYLARVQIEATSPISVQTGHAELNFDTALVRDANGLPSLPATSIRGVLRHLYLQQLDLRQLGKEKSQALFGYGQLDQQTGEDDAQISQVQVSWGMVHDSNNTPIEGRIDPSQDSILDELSQSQPLKRERVRLNDKGCAEDNGKFDVTAAPKGVRFTFELKYWSDQENDSSWLALLNLLKQPAFRLGSNTRSGFGALCIKQIKSRCFNLKNAEDATAWQNLSRKLSDFQALQTHSTEALSTKEGHIIATINLTGEGFMRIGGGDIPVHNSEEPADLPMQSEKYLLWDINKASFSQRYPLIPASAIKGALAHRLTFHSNRLNEQFSDKDRAKATLREQCIDVKQLFGYASDTDKTTDGQRKTEGAAGQVLLNDIYLDKPIQTSKLWHNKIDRFTGGVIDGALYSEEVLYKPEFTISLTFLKPEKVGKKAREALLATLKDLCQGRLPLGASGSRGLGSCTGDIVWSDEGQWIKGGA
ncbi:RAMP superfamily CRISPR-associated protein [Neptunomonas sp.]|uniref:RAMP superfamily CRISPR-associated protein n=1 Tax=Neptunomonas sp. TaxID=1971898 RepID=UPI00356A4469